MGMHFLNGSLLGDGEVTVETPEILLYEPLPNGRLRLTGADYLVDQVEWDSKPEHKGPPELMGQLFHLFDSPNRFGLKLFYALHVWPEGQSQRHIFELESNVSCDAFPESRSNAVRIRHRRWPNSSAQCESAASRARVECETSRQKALAARSPLRWRSAGMCYISVGPTARS
jgi:hypothetical protein